jgi:hypothetical protein
MDKMVVARMTGYMDCLVKEAIEIWLHPDYYNRDTDFPLNCSWHPNIIKQMRELERSYIGPAASNMNSDDFSQCGLRRDRTSLSDSAHHFLSGSS